MNNLDDAVEQLMSEFPDIFEQLDNIPDDVDFTQDILTEMVHTNNDDNVTYATYLSNPQYDSQYVTNSPLDHNDVQYGTNFISVGDNLSYGQHSNFTNTSYNLPSAGNGSPINYAQYSDISTFNGNLVSGQNVQNGIPILPYNLQHGNATMTNAYYSDNLASVRQSNDSSYYTVQNGGNLPYDSESSSPEQVHEGGNLPYASGSSNPVQVQEGGEFTHFITQTSRVHNDKFNSTMTTYKIGFSNSSANFSAAAEEIRIAFENLSQEFINIMGNHDKIRIVLYHDSLERPISIPFLRRGEVNAQTLINSFERVAQSHKDVKLNIDNSLSAHVIIAHLPSGTGRKMVNLKKQQKPYIKKKDRVVVKNECDKNEFQNFCENQPYIVTVYNNDNLCALRAIMIGMAYADENPIKSEFSKPYSKVLDNFVNKAARELNLPNKPCGIAEIKKIESFFCNYQVTIINCDGKIDKTPIYIGPPNNKFVYLCYTGSHYNVITSMKRFYDRSYYCDFCKKAYNNLQDHKCDQCCKSCNRIRCQTNLVQECSHCNIECKSEKCLKIHNERFCKQVKICKTCNFYKGKHHVCGENERWCKNCSKSVNHEHRCYIKNDTEKSNNKDFAGFIFFDYEAYQLNGIHVPNLVMAKKICVGCIDAKEECEFCREKYIFYDNEIFCKWLFKHDNYIAVAHNLKGYDGVFILKYILSSFLPTDSMPSVIVTGTKILSIKFRKLKLIDSHSFLTMPLSDFSSTFGLKETKGFFPHLFNLPQNQDYVGPYPDKKFYGSEFFSSKKKAEFDAWYDSVKDKTFNFRQQFLDYCWSDVLLLAHGCLAFRKIIMERTKLSKNDYAIDPFLSSITIASLCHHIFRSKIMKPETIGIIPENGYHPEHKTSIKCQLWLKYLSEKKNIRIQHSKNGGEVQVGKYRIDGYAESTNTYYEFHGCLFHGCQKCYKSDTFNSFKQETMGTTHEKHKKRIKEIRQLIKGSRLVEMWECDWDRCVKSDPNLAKFISQCNIREPINPRDALFGGRTNGVKLHHKCQGNEKIKYVDITSLYPFVQKYCNYPIGHPELITENFGDVFDYFGLIKCKILPPRQLYFPVLPSRINNKLVFPLCRTCAEQKLKKCSHSVEEKSLEGTWCTLEVHEALRQGYQIVEIYEIWHWKEIGRIFGEYVDMFLKGKQEADGYPENAKTDEEKERYIKNYFEREGVLLDGDKIEANKGLRSVMKMLLNSFWGRFGMNTNKTQYKVISDPLEWFEMVADDQYIINNADFSHPNYVQVFYSIDSDMHEGSTQTSVVLAAFVTCHARLKLYEELKKLGQRVLYFDTDSIIYVSVPGLYDPPLGDYLGDFTDEIKKKGGSHIVEFISAGPKNYAYELDNGKTSCTVKGFSLNHLASLVINYDAIRDIVLNDRDRKLEVEQLKFSRDKKNWYIKTDVVSKLYGFVYDKRILLDSFYTLPYGY